MKSIKLTGLICGSVLSLAGSSFAQQTSSTDPGSSTSPSSASQPGSTTLGQSSSAGGVGASATSTGSMHSGNNVRLSQIMNTSVQSAEGKPLGNIRDVMVDPQTGRIGFAILSLSSAGGATDRAATGHAATDTSTAGRETVPSSRTSVTGAPSSPSSHSTMGKLIPVPWQLFSQSWKTSPTAGRTGIGSEGAQTGAPTLVLNLDEAKLRGAPSFESSNWNELQGGTFDQRVYSHFGVDRNSGTGTSGSSISGQGASGTLDHSNRYNNSPTPQNSGSKGSSSQNNSSPNSSTGTSPK